MQACLQLQHAVTTRADTTPRAARIAAMFGLPLDKTHQHTIIPTIQLALAPSQIVFTTGVSGGGKSTLLRLIQQAFESSASNDSHEPKPALVSSHHLPDLDEQPLVESLATPEGNPPSAPAPAELECVCHWLSLAGLNDAAVMLRRPSELSEGQRYRLRLAQAIAIAERRPEPWTVLLADEFGSNLDRITAKALARSARRWVSRSNICLVAATAHDDLLEPFEPDTLVQVEPGGRCDVHNRTSATQSS